MNYRRLQAILLVLCGFTAIGTMGCGEEIDESECRFANPDVVAHIKGRMIDFPKFLWKVDDRAHIFLEEDSDRPNAPTWSIDLRSGAVIEHETPWVMNPKYKGLRLLRLDISGSPMTYRKLSRGRRHYEQSLP